MTFGVVESSRRPSNPGAALPRRNLGVRMWGRVAGWRNLTPLCDAQKRRPRAGTRGRLGERTWCAGHARPVRAQARGHRRLAGNRAGTRCPGALVRRGEDLRTSGKASLGRDGEGMAPRPRAQARKERLARASEGSETGSCRHRWRRRPARPRCGGAGCTWPRGRCGRGRRS